MPDERIALVSVPRELKALTDGIAPTYRRIWEATADGDLPAEQINGRWFIKRADLPPSPSCSAYSIRMPRAAARSATASQGPRRRSRIANPTHGCGVRGAAQSRSIIGGPDDLGVSGRFVQKSTLS